MRPSFPNLPGRLSKFTSRSIQTLQIFLVKLSCHIGDVLIDLALKSDDIQPLHQKEPLALRRVFQSVFHTEFSRLPGGLRHFADSNSIPLNQPTICHPILILATLLKYLLSLVVRLFQQCHLSRVDEVLKFHDSMIDLHIVFQCPMNCLCK